MSNKTTQDLIIVFLSLHFKKKKIISLTMSNPHNIVRSMQEIYEVIGLFTFWGVKLGL
jgi:hypothetical protein